MHGKQTVFTVIVGFVALFALALGAAAQTEPTVAFEAEEVHEPLPPLEVTNVTITVEVSCEGWGEAATETSIRFRLAEVPEEYEASLDPQETVLPAGTGECTPGETVAGSTILGLEPSNEAPAGEQVEASLEVFLEERVEGEIIEEHGPYEHAMLFETGFLSLFNLRPGPTVVEASSGSTVETYLEVESFANGPAELHVNLPEDTESLVVTVEPDPLVIQPGSSERVTILIEDKNPNPFTRNIQSIPLTATFSPTEAHADDPEAHSVDAHILASFDAWITSPTNMVKILLIAGLIATGAIALQQRWQPDP